MEKEDAVGVVDIAIIGGGICGLSLAVALRKKGVRSSIIVIEKSETLRSGGAGLAIWGNGWRALDHLGVGYKLRHPSSFITNRMIEVNLDTGKQINAPVSYGEARFAKRSDLMDALASELPESTIRYGSQVMSLIKLENEGTTSLQLSNGTIIKAKVVVGCDGANSVIQGFLNMNPNKMSSLWGVRGFTSYENGHSFSPEFFRVKKGTTLWGRVAIDHKLVFWFLVLKLQPPQGGTKPANYYKDQNLIKQLTIEETTDFPGECREIINNCDITTLSLVQLTYRPPWDLLFDTFHRTTSTNVTVAGDAMHVMFPFSGQGGSAAIEDAIVLARCLSSGGSSENERKKQVEEYVKERRMRLLWLSTETYLKGMMLEMSDVSNSLLGFVVKMLIMVVLMVLFRDPIQYTLYDCGGL